MLKRVVRGGLTRSYKIAPRLWERSDRLEFFRGEMRYGFRIQGAVTACAQITVLAVCAISQSASVGSTKQGAIRWMR